MNKPSKLRIIGGRWRSRVIQFHPAPGLRPTSDRVRETLFNWLQPYLQGAVCLDAFCGSGALGLEALSRYAKQVDFVDNHGPTVRQLSQQLTLLQAEEMASSHCQSSLDWLAQTQRRYDIIFLDPPFASQLLAPALTLITQRQLLQPHGMLYLETPKELPDELYQGWQSHRKKQAGQVLYQLLTPADPQGTV